MAHISLNDVSKVNSESKMWHCVMVSGFPFILMQFFLCYPIRCHILITSALELTFTCLFFLQNYFGTIFGTYCGFWKKVFHRAPANPWIRAQQNLQKEMWVLWRVRSACTAAGRCRFGSLATHRTNVNTLIRLHGCTGWSKSAGHTCNFLSDRLCSGSDCRAMESSSDMLHNKHWWEQNGCAFYAISLVSSPGLHQAGRV